MKEPIEWDENDLNVLIRDRAEENINREFKRGEALGDKSSGKRIEECKIEISKDVSSFANSAGGVIIYGLEEQKKEPHAAKSLTPIDPNDFSKDWLEQVINSRIKPAIQGLRIRPVPLDHAHPGKFAYVVIIPTSFTAHQASDKRYYKRYNFQSVAMEDYEVRQTMNRAQKPSFKIEVIAGCSRSEIKFGAIVQNTSELVGHEVSVVMLFPEQLARTHSSTFQYEKLIGLTYIKVSSDEFLSTFAPLSSRRFRFSSNPFLIPAPSEGSRCKAFIRVYDQFGRAAESEFELTLYPEPGKIYDVIQHGRAELYS